ncbi:hypothetical protein EG240_02015 [Paenimyroides tangerinum]|uniref:SH3 domain-containing protein n=1 Tax=Paenimyroides tangerinum TaxID=2488728 RepID=A0A3P3WJ74_9FLAO|nr:hypothetical protein [Paenimyroides tangerinum]RRJ92813.1 hypothetical protein EG240_02015 [Paenimyroides tangerinum]
MKKILLVFILFSTSIYGQFYKIVDKDGYVNLRDKPNSNSKIVSKIKSGEYVLEFDYTDNPNWMNVDFSSNNDESIGGFIHKSRLISLKDFTPINFIKTIDNVMYFENKALNIEVVISIDDFNKKVEGKYLSKKNGFLGSYKGKEIWGTDGNIPRKKYKSIVIIQKAKRFEIPTLEFENLFEPHFFKEQADSFFIDIRYDSTDDIITISSLNSDAAGAYAVLFVIKNGKLINKKTVIPF